MSVLFEYGCYLPIQRKNELKSYLCAIWRQRVIEESEEQEQGEDEDERYQPFLQFDDSSIRANNYIGFIQHEKEVIEIYPKVFKRLDNPSKALMLKHIFFWLSYCRKWKFPFNQTNLDSAVVDSFPELIIYLLASQFHETISRQPFMQYQSIEDRMTTPRGIINFSRYINRSLTTGNYHQIEVDYEPFMFDNKVNRAIKYCSRLLMNQTRFAESQRLLQEIVFILDEVEDTPVSVYEINSLKVNPFFDDYIQVMEMCKTILNQQVYSHNSYDFSQWCLLLPMEYIFEDFLAGFFESHFSSKWKVEYQKSNYFLSTNPRAFQMQHDIFLTNRADGRKIIIDTKYKVRDYERGDVKRGVSQADMYQVISYAFRRGCTEVILVYPNKEEIIAETETFEVSSDFEGSKTVKVKVVEIPFWSMENFTGKTDKLKFYLNTIIK